FTLTAPAPTQTSPLSLHDALPISELHQGKLARRNGRRSPRLSDDAATECGEQLVGDAVGTYGGPPEYGRHGRQDHRPGPERRLRPVAHESSGVPVSSRATATKHARQGDRR